MSGQHRAEPVVKSHRKALGNREFCHKKPDADRILIVSKSASGFGGDGGIRTPGRFDPSTDFESASLRPLRYISMLSIQGFAGFCTSGPDAGTAEQSVENVDIQLWESAAMQKTGTILFGPPLAYYAIRTAKRQGAFSTEGYKISGVVMLSGPRILISGTVGRMEAYAAAVEAAGGDAFAAYAPEAWEGFSGLLLCGGGDITPGLFGAPDSGLNGGIDHRRERSDLALLPAFLAQRKPILGICRGMQMLNVALGGTLVQDLGEGNTLHAGTAEGDRFHPVVAEPDSVLCGLYGSHFQVNSCHHQAVQDPAPGFRAVSRAEDGVVEGMEHESLPVIAVQWHPERLCLEHRRADAADGLALFRHFVRLSGR